MPDWLPYLLSYVGGAFSGGVGAWAWMRTRIENFESFTAMDKRREEDWKGWRQDINQQVRRLEDRPYGTSAIMERLDQIEEKLETHFREDREQYSRLATMFERTETMRREIETLKGGRTRGSR